MQANGFTVTQEVRFDLTVEELSERTAAVGTVNVKGKDGKLARFWVDVRMVNGKPVLQVTTKASMAKDKDVRKQITGRFNIEKA